MPTQYQIPSWLETSPNDVANKFATGVQIGAQLGEARNRLAQQAQQSAVETQVTQDKLAASMLQQQQELNVKKAYEDQQVALAQQKIQAAQAKVGLETVKAARQFQAQQAYQKDYQAGLDMGLPEDEAARGSYFKNLVQFGSPASQASAMRPGNQRMAQIPQSVTLNDPQGNPFNFAYVPGGTTLHPIGQSTKNAGQGVETRLGFADLTDLRRQRAEAAKALATDDTGKSAFYADEKTLGAGGKQDKARYAQGKSQLDALDAQIAQTRGQILGGGGQAPAPANAHGTDYDWESGYGPSAAPAPSKAAGSNIKSVKLISPATGTNSPVSAPASAQAAPAPAPATIPDIPGISSEKPTSQAERKKQASLEKQASAQSQYEAQVAKSRKDYSEKITKERTQAAYDQSKATAQNLYTGLKNYAANPDVTTVTEEEYQRRRSQLADLLSKLTPEDRKAITGE